MHVDFVGESQYDEVNMATLSCFKAVSIMR